MSDIHNVAGLIAGWHARRIYDEIVSTGRIPEGYSPPSVITDAVEVITSSEDGDDPVVVERTNEELDALFNAAAAEHCERSEPRSGSPRSEPRKEPPKTMKMLSRKRQLEIINDNQTLIGTKFADAIEFVSGQGLSLHIIYVGKSQKYPLKEYNPAVLGVRVRDANFDFDTHAPSDDAFITDIIDVGGIDIKNRGASRT